MKRPMASEQVRVADHIFEDLRQSIVRGDWPRGTRLPTERSLAERYGVSGPTIREAIRGLSVLGLIEVRHGSGAYVTADIDALVALSLGSIIQLEQLGVAEVMHVFGVVSREIAGLAAQHGRPLQITALRRALSDLDAASTLTDIVDRLRAFHGAFAAASGNALLGALCVFLAKVQLDLAVRVVDASLADWRAVIAQLQASRAAMVDAISRGMAAEASRLAEAFALQAEELITSIPKVRHVRATDPKLAGLLASALAGTAV